MTTTSEATLSPAAENNGQLWGGKAQVWAEIQEPISLPLYRAALERADVGRATAYLDVGCGSGHAAAVGAQRGARVAGVDASAALLAIARERVPAADFRRGELEALPFEANTFDLITGFHSVQVPARPTVPLQEARRLSPPGARVVL